MSPHKLACGGDRDFGRLNHNINGEKSIMRKIKKIVLFTVFVAIGGLAALAGFPAERIYAGTYDISAGDIAINCTSGGQTVTHGGDSQGDIDPVITGTSNSHSITINTDAGCIAKVKLNGVNIDVSSVAYAAAVKITGDGNAVILLDKNSILHSGDGCAGIEKNNSGSLEIKGYGSLTATGGADGAGIGGGRSSAGSNITITGGTVSANGGENGAGIGGGKNGVGSDITITGGTVSANGGKHGAGIGGGRSSAGSNITITGGTVSANGGENGAGIGGGYEGAGSHITITDGTVTATGGENGAGIGGGFNAAGSNITIEGGEVTSAGGESGAGIGGGAYKAGSDITIKGGTVSSTGGNGGAGIGGGFNAAGSNITIEGGEVSANGGEYGTGIGGGQGGEGSHITITAGTVSANGGESGAGIGGGYERAGSDITITGGTVSANGGESGAGIGGGYGGEGLAITITGGEVTATGGLYGAGIGGGRRGGGNERSGFGSNITIVGGTVISAGGKSGAGIGGGNNAEGSGITISNNAIVRTAGGSAYSTYGAGAAIGDGGKSGSVSGNSCSPDVSGLSDIGYAKLYDPGTTIEAIKNGTATSYWIIKAPKTITFDANGGNCTTDPTQTVSRYDGSQVLESLPNATRENYIFAGWFTAAEGGDEITTASTFTGNTTIYAHWVLIYTITFDANGGTVSPTSGTTDRDRKLGELPTPEWNGHIFIGWFTETDGGTEVTTSKVYSSNATVYAHWVPIYTITFDPNGGTVSPTSGTTGADGKLASLPTPVWNGHTFTGWFTAASGGTEVRTSKVYSSNATVYAHWVPIYTITFDPNGGTVFPTSGTTGTDGKLASLPTPERDGYTFTGWFTEIDGGTEVTASKVYSSNETIYAHWDEIPKPEKKADKPVLIKATSNSISVKAEEGVEYSIDGGTNWKSTGIFTGLNEDRDYSVIARYASSGDKAAGEPSEALAVRTLKVVNIVSTKTLNVLGNEISIDTVVSLEENSGYSVEQVEIPDDVLISLFNDLSEEERNQVINGSNFTIKIKITEAVIDMEDERVKNNKKIADEKIKEKTGATVVAPGIMLDISLFVQVGDNEERKAYSVNGSGTVSFIIKVPGEMINTDSSIIRTFYLIHIHDNNGEAEIVYYGTDTDIPVVTDSFSYWYLTYVDEKKDDNKKEENNEEKKDDNLNNANTSVENVITVSDNKPMAYSEETKGDFRIGYCHEIPFFGKSKPTVDNFGGMTVSQGNATYNVTKIKVNKKKHLIQITGLSGADKDTEKKIKKATKGSNGLSFKCNPYFVRDTDSVTPKFKKNGEPKSVKVKINGKDYKAKKEEFSFDSEHKQIQFKGSNLNGSYKIR